MKTNVVENSKTQKTGEELKQNAPNNLKQRRSVQSRGKQIHSFQNINEFENSRQPDSNIYEVSKQPSYSFAQQSFPLHTGQLPSLAPTQANFSNGEVYMGINAVPSEIYRIENVRPDNQAHAYNLMSASSDETISADSLQTAGNNFITYSYAGNANHFDAYNMKGQHSQDQFSSDYQGQTVNQRQYEYQSHQGKVLYQGETHQLQSSNQDHFKSQHQGEIYLHDGQTQGQPGPGQPAQGQGGQDYVFQGHVNQDNVGYLKDYQYENHPHPLTSEYSMNQNLLDQNMNYSHATDSYQCAQSLSLNRQTASQDSNVNFTNSNYQEKTTLPSFFQLSSQLSCSARY